MFTIKKTCSHEIPLKIDREILKKIMVRLSSARVVRLPDVVAPVLQPFSSPLPDFVQHPSKATLAGAGGGSGEKRGNKRAEHVDFTWESWVRTMENFVFWRDWDLSGSRWWFLSRKPAVLPTRTNKHGVFEPKNKRFNETHEVLIQTYQDMDPPFNGFGRSRWWILRLIFLGCKTKRNTSEIMVIIHIVMAGSNSWHPSNSLESCNWLRLEAWIFMCNYHGSQSPTT